MFRLSTHLPFVVAMALVVVASNILGEPREANHEAVPRVTYTDPQAAAVGASPGLTHNTHK